MRNIRDAKSGDRDAMYAALKKLQAAKEGEIAKLLTPTKFQKYKVELDGMREERRQNR